MKREERGAVVGGPRSMNPEMICPDRYPTSNGDREKKRGESWSPPKEGETPDRDDPSTYGGWPEGRPEVSIVRGPMIESGLSQIQGETRGNSGERTARRRLDREARDTDVTLGPRTWKPG